MAETISFEDAWGAKPKETLSFEDAQSLPSKALDFMTGYTRSIIGQGMGMGLGDEAEAGVRSLIPGQGGYTENLDRIRSEQEKFSQDHPVIATGAEIAGGMVPAVLSRGKTAPASLTRATGRAMGEGAGYGAAYGFGTGEGVEDRISGAGLGGALGGAVGAVASPLSFGAAWAGRELGRPAFNRIRSLVNPDAEAARRVAGAIETDAGQGLTQAQQAYARQASGQPVTNMDSGGETTRALARSAMNQSPEARATLDKSINDRFVGQGERINSWLQSRTGFSGDASAKRDALLDQARKANRPAYAKAYSAGNKNLASPELDRLMQAPEVQAAAQAALKSGKSRAVAERMPWNPNVRNLQFWDYVKRELDGAAGVAGRAGDKGRADVLSTLSRDLRAELDAMVPDFKAARAGAAQFFGAEDALEAGQKFINLNVDVKQARRAILKMSPAERDLFAEGFVSSIMDKVNRVRDRANVIQQIWGSQKSREQIETALGSQKAREFEVFMGVEEIMDRARSAQGNSTTARQLVELGLAGTTGGLAWWGTGDLTTGVLVAALTRGGRAVSGRVTQGADDSVAKRVAEMLTSDDPTIYKRGLQTIAKSDALLARIRSTVSSFAGVTAGQQGSQLGGAGE